MQPENDFSGGVLLEQETVTFQLSIRRGTEEPGDLIALAEIVCSPHEAWRVYAAAVADATRPRPLMSARLPDRPYTLEEDLPAVEYVGPPITINVSGESAEPDRLAGLLRAELVRLFRQGVR